MSVAPLSVAEDGARLADTRRPSLWPLWALIAVFFVPLAAAWLLYLQPGWLPVERSNRGEFLQPPLPLGPWLTPPSQTALSSTSEGQWSLMTVAPTSCGQRCRERIHDLRQIRLAAGADRARIRRVLAVGATAPEASRQWLGRRYAGTAIVRLPSSAAGALGQDSLDEGAVFIIDPRGYLTLRFPANSSAKDILHDLKRLMKAVNPLPEERRYAHT